MKKVQKILAATIVCFAISSLILSCKSKEEKFQEYTLKSLQAAAKGDEKAAEKYAAKAAKYMDPEDIEELNQMSDELKDAAAALENIKF